MKLFNPSNIDFDAVKKMTPEQKMEYFKQIQKNEFVKMWIQWTYNANIFCINNTWQYIVALWMM